MSSIAKKVIVALVTAALVCTAAFMIGCGGSNGSSSGAAKNANTTANANKDSNSNKNSAASNKNTSNANYVKSVSDDDPYGKGIHHATVKVEGYDPFTIELDADNAPISVSNFCKLANDGFYNGLTFYRFQDQFCMQGGSSNNGTAVVDDGLSTIKGEFSSNKVDNKLADNFKKGTVAMARSQDKNSATSTFFVTLSSGAMVEQSLNGQYAAFGTIDDADMEIVDHIVADHLADANKDTSGMGVINDVSKQAKIESITITD